MAALKLPIGLNLQEVNSTSPNNGFLFNLLANNLANSWILSMIINMVAIFIIALLLNRLLVNNKYVSPASFLPALAVILFTSIVASVNIFNGQLLANIMLLFAFLIAVSMVNTEVKLTSVFNIAFIISLASLFYFPYIYFGLFAFMVLLILRVTNWREWLLVVVGLALPYLWAFAIAYLFQQTDNFILQASFSLPTLFNGFDANYGNLIRIITFILITLAGVFALISNVGSKPLKTRKFVSMVVSLLVIATLVFVGYSTGSISDLSILLIPSSIIFACLLGNNKAKLQTELWHFALFGMVLTFEIIKLINK